MGERIYLNNEWRFSTSYQEDMIANDYSDEKMDIVRLPHTCRETPFNYFDEDIYQMVCLYRRKLYAPNEWKGKKLLLTLEGVAHISEVFINGEKVGEHGCGYTAYTMDLSDKLKFDEDNIIAVKVDSRESSNIPPFGYVIDYMTYGGIYRDVYLEVKEDIYIKDVFLHSLISSPSAVLNADVEINDISEDLYICQYIRPNSESEYVLLGEKAFENDYTDMSVQWKIDSVILWDINNPFLYEIKTQLRRGEQIVDEVSNIFGFREAIFKEDGFYLNGKKVKIRGLNRHQSYPYVGYAMPKSMQEHDAEILKNELGLNAVRTSHYPQSHYFLNQCDLCRLTARQRSSAGRERYRWAVRRS